jgi:uncharacterized membrane protein YphA (DoxX/SURF4 family)
MPEFTISIMAILSMARIACGFLIIFGLKVKSSSLYVVVCFCFIFAIIIAMSKGLNINCGCFTQTYQKLAGLRLLKISFCSRFVYLYFNPNSKLNLIRKARTKI